MEFGAHVSSSGGIDTAIDRIAAIGGDCVQGFTQSPRMWRTTAHQPETLDRFRAKRRGAGNGRVARRSLAGLEVLLDALDRHPRLGVCLDSCHLYASGYDLTDRSVVDELVAELDAGVGLERLRALHVNDSGAERGSNRDRHANILEGL